VANAYLNARFITHFATYPPGWTAGWLTDPRFVGGVALFLVGFAINQHADEVLRKLRGPSEQGYKIPEGGLYRFVSAPNYFGELVEWSGFALAAWSPAGLAFAVWTAANLVPRAWANHRWYRRTFPEYPTARRALVPFLF
jgi:steroid 5-alpha reductase family enzyme